MVPAWACVVRTSPRATAAFRTGEKAADVITPTRLPSCSRSEPGSGQGDPGSNRSPFKTWLTCPSGIDPSDGLLTQVAPFDETDRAVVAAEFLRQVFLGDFLAEDRRARFDAQNIEALRRRPRSGRGPGRFAAGSP